jgi:NAD(P)-dependent dehydrogenase (short-subunit alcohol dehydrogenase family)
MMRAVIITGSNGGIGAALKAKFTSEGYAVIGIGKSPDAQCCAEYIQVDFAALIKNVTLRIKFGDELASILSKYELKALVNNSATQILAPLDSLSFEMFQETLGVNVSFPFLLSKLCLKSLETTKGSIINIGSIHAKLTKKNFVAYATSKGALETMTRAMAVDIGHLVRVNLIAPAAIETEMLKAGFGDDIDGYNKLKSFHPVGDVGSTAELAKFVFAVTSEDFTFLNGGVIEYSGGIHGVLSDPSAL